MMIISMLIFAIILLALFLRHKASMSQLATNYAKLQKRQRELTWLFNALYLLRQSEKERYQQYRRHMFRQLMSSREEAEERIAALDEEALSTLERERETETKLEALQQLLPGNKRTFTVHGKKFSAVVDSIYQSQDGIRVYRYRDPFTSDRQFLSEAELMKKFLAKAKRLERMESEESAQREVQSVIQRLFQRTE